MARSGITHTGVATIAAAPSWETCGVQRRDPVACIHPPHAAYSHALIRRVAVRPDAKMDGSKPISGGLSHCFPQFGPGEIQQHGFARNVDWTVEDLGEASCTLSMKPSDYSKEMWDKDFGV